MRFSDERLPRAVYSVPQVRDLDRRAIEELGIPGYELMTRAAAAALAALRARWPAARSLHVYCGAGNNAGDGYLFAAQALAAGFRVRVAALVPLDRLRGDAAQAAVACIAAGVVAPFDRTSFAADGAPDVIVDALLGTGLDREVTGDFAAAIAAINSSGVPVLSLDVPSGLDASTGLAHGSVVRASLTVTFVALKQGLYLGVAEDYCGEIQFADLGLPATLAHGLPAPLERLTRSEIAAALPRRARSAHKGDCGRVVLIGGAPGTSGAIRLAAEAALRTGAGLVYVGTAAQSVSAVSHGRPEIMCRVLTNERDVDALLALADVAVIGPGLGQDAWAQLLWQRTLATDLPLVVDADGLNLLAAQPVERGRWVLTPHPGEAGRMLGMSAAAVQQDRAVAAHALAHLYGGVAVLKGARTLIAAGASPPLAVCDRGNPGMASGGMGDVLAGVIASVLAQCGNLVRAARAGVLLHALAGDAAAADGERGLLASDLFSQLRKCANPT